MKFGLNPEVVKQRWFQQSLLLAVILVTAWSRFWRLPKLPPGLWWDEAYNAMDAIWMLDNLAPKLFL